MRGMMHTKSLLLRIVLFLISLFPPAGLTAKAFPQEAPSDLLKTADEIIARVTTLRGLQPKGPIQKGVKSRSEISRFLESHVKENYDEEQLQSEGRVMQKLGLIPTSMDYKDFTLKLLTEQVGGYYDPEKKTFFIAAWLPIEQQKPVMVHELTHALQDQYFDIGRFQKEDRQSHNDDRSLARQAVFEGDAMAVMLDYMLEPAGRNFTQLPNLVTVMRQQFSSMESQFDVFKQAPMFLKEELLFPYGYGAAFLQKLRSTQPWDAVNKLYLDFPASTEQIIHPEKYLEPRDQPRDVELQDPSPGLSPGWKSTYHNVLGEFTLYLMLKAFIPEETAKTAAAGWGGDQVMLLQNSNGDSAVFVSSVWDTVADAGQFYAAMDTWFKIRFPESKRSEESASGFHLSTPAGFHALRQEGDRVRFVVGLPESEASRITGW
jgi:hypothetical protein